jgi:hypothetical protein
LNANARIAKRGSARIPSAVPGHGSRVLAANAHVATSASASAAVITFIARNATVSRSSDAFTMSAASSVHTGPYTEGVRSHCVHASHGSGRLSGRTLGTSG